VRRAPPFAVGDNGHDWEPRKKKKHDEAANLPEDMPPAVRNALEWAADAVHRVSIPGFVAPAEEAASPPPMTDSGQWQMPLNAPAVGMISNLLDPNDSLVGVLYVRGTAEWRNWRRIFLVGLALAVFGGIFSSIFNLWLFNAIGTLCWLYLLIQGFRLWKGSIGHYYVGVTSRGVAILPMSVEGHPQTQRAESAPWGTIHRLNMTTEYLWVESSGSEPVAFLGWIPAQGTGGLGRQRKGLLSSPVAQLIREKGFVIKQ
jgi:hypothetical protein